MAVVDWGTPQESTGTAGPTVALTQRSSLSTSDTYTFENDGRTLLVVKKGAGASTATVVTPATTRGVAIVDPTYTIAASTEFQVLGPFAPDLCNDSSNKVTISFSEITGLVVSVVRLA